MILSGIVHIEVWSILSRTHLYSEGNLKACHVLSWKGGAGKLRVRFLRSGSVRAEIYHNHVLRQKIFWL
jgi:hypothetical protein